MTSRSREEAGGGGEDSLTEVGVLLAGLLLLEVLETGPAVVAAHRRQVEIDVVEPLGGQGFEQERAEGAALGTAQAL